MAADPGRDYEAIPYPGHAFGQTHPSRLCTVARLHGLDPAPPDRCRVLELGCGDGGNLLPMAWEFPGSAFLGVDLAAGAVEAGRRGAAALGLRNLDLRVLDVRAVDDSFGTFDYVVAHGLYSWVPAPVREAILALCRARLAPHGVAFVSYNALPGGHLRLMLRQMLIHHAAPFPDPKERIRQAAGLIRLLASHRRAGDPYAALLMDWIEDGAGMAEASLYHDLLSEENAHFHFLEFAGDAARHGLRYLSEADWADTRTTRFPPDVVATLHAVTGGDPLRMEQYLDFYRLRRFRQTLLVREDAPVVRDVPPTRTRGLHAASEVTATGPVDLAPGAEATFSGDRGARIVLRDPLPKAALAALAAARPRVLPFDGILAAARAALGRGGDGEMEADRADLAELLLGGFGAALLTLYSHAPRIASRAGDRPEVAAPARLAARTSDRVPNLRHDTVHLDDALSRAMVALLDGTRDRAALLRDMAAAAVAGEFPLPGAPPPRDAGEAATRIEPLVEDALAGLCRVALLVEA